MRMQKKEIAINKTFLRTINDFIELDMSNKWFHRFDILCAGELIIFGAEQRNKNCRNSTIELQMTFMNMYHISIDSFASINHVMRTSSIRFDKSEFCFK